MSNEEKVIKEYPPCIFCGEPTVLSPVKDSHGGHLALVCSKCHKFQWKRNVQKPNLEQLISKLVGIDLFWSTMLKKFFDSLNKNEEEKIQFLEKLGKQKELFNEFTKKLIHTYDAEELYNLYNGKMVN